MRTRTPLTEAIDQLVAENRSKQFPDNITDAEALQYVDHDVVLAWKVRESGLRSMQGILADMVTELTDAEADSVLNCLLNETDTARRILASCLSNYVAKDIRYAAQEDVDNYEPPDDYTVRQSYAAEVDDPTIADRRHLARSYRNV